MGRWIKHPIDIALLCLGVVAAVALLVPTIVVVFLISIIGIPLAFIFMAAPVVFLVLAMARLVQKLLGGGVVFFFVGIFVALGVLAIFPWWQNAWLEQKANAFVADDHDDLAKPFTAGVLAIRNGNFHYGTQGWSSCDDFCLRALLNRQAKAIIVTEVKNIDEPINLAGKALLYRMDRLPSCPAVMLRQGLASISVPGEKRFPAFKDATELMRLEIAKGNCLIEREARLSEADAIISVGRIAQGQSEFSAGLELDADTVTADRKQVHIMQGGGFKEVYRWTGVCTQKLAPILAPTVVPGFGLEMGAGFFRIPSCKNISEKFYSGIDLGAFLVDGLGMDLQLHPVDVEVETRGIIHAALGRPGPIDAVTQGVIDDFFEGLRDKRAIPDMDVDVILKALADPRVAIPQGLWATIRNGKDLPESYFKEMADILFGRLRAFSIFANGKFDYGQAERLNSLDTALELLPAHAILAHRSDLEWLAHQEYLRVLANRTLRQLHYFGGDAVPTLLFLMDDGKRFDEANKESLFRDGRGWQNPYFAGLGGLCLMGQAGSSATQPLFERLDANAGTKYGSSLPLVIRTLTSLGASPDDIWSHVQAGDKTYTRESFDREVARAVRKRECS